MDDDPGGREEHGISEDPQEEENGSSAHSGCSKVGQLRGVLGK